MDKHLGRLPILLESLKNAFPHKVTDCTEGHLKKIMGSNIPCRGVYLINRYSTGELVYVGKSSNLQQRIGSDHRNARSGSLIFKIKDDSDISEAVDIDAAKSLFHSDYFVRWVCVEESDFRAVFEVYAVANLNTKYNKDFLEDR